MKRWLAVLGLIPALSMAACPAVLDYRIPRLMGGTLDLCTLQDHPVLVVNTASHCGFTPQFKGLQQLHEKYGPRGLIVLGVPSNDFFQELGSDAEVGQFCSANYGVTFPMTTRLHVRGSDAHPFFKGLIAATDESAMWNFHKYLILPQGKGVKAFGTRTSPDDPDLVRAIESAL